MDLFFNNANTNGTIFKDTYNGTSWNNWSGGNMGSGYNGDPDIMAYNNDLQVFARDTSNNIEQRYWSYSGQSWSGWASLGGSSDNLASDPFAYQYSSSELDLFANDNSANDYHDTQTNGWSGFSQLN
jgi:hypothetical protein